jgi:hypothetical protein
MEDQISEAQFVLVVCTETYYRRYRGNERPGTGLGGRWESNLIRDQLYGDGARLRKFIPVLPHWSSKCDIPEPLQHAATRYVLPEDYAELYRYLTRQPRTPAPPLGARRVMPPRTPPRRPVIEPDDSEQFSEPLRMRYAEVGRIISTLTEQQHRVIRELRGHRRALISGCAGSGKTLVAAEKALRLDHAGLRTLFVCHNPRLAEWVASLVDGTAVTVTSFEALVTRLAAGDATSGAAGWTNYSQPTNDVLEAALGTLTNGRPGFDAVIVDEGQDFDARWWEVIDACVCERGGILFIFFDDQQALLPFRADYPIGEQPYDLSRNCRNAGRVYDLMRALNATSPAPDDALASHGDAIVVHASATMASALRECLDWLDDQDGLEDCVAVLGGASPFEESVLADKYTIGAGIDWHAAVSSELRRLAAGTDGSIAWNVSEGSAERALKRLSDAPAPSQDDVVIISDLLAHPDRTRRAGAARGLAWGDPSSVRRSEGPDAPPRLLRPGEPRFPPDCDVVAALRTGHWARVLPEGQRRVVGFAPHQMANASQIPVYSIGEITGLERDVVLVVMQGRAPAPVHELYVGVSRARVKLAVAIDDSVLAGMPPRFKAIADARARSASEAQSSKVAKSRAKNPPSRRRQKYGRSWQR